MYKFIQKCCKSKLMATAVGSATSQRTTKSLFEASSKRKFTTNVDVRNLTCQRYSFVVELEEAKRFVCDCFRAINVPQFEATCLADMMIAADYRGVYCEGIARLERFIEQVCNEYVDILATPEIKFETAAVACVDGKNGLGVMVGNYCMDLAIQKATNCGIGWVNVRNSNDIGMASWYLLRAMQNNLIAMVMSNSSPTVIPTNGMHPEMGSNCFAFGTKGVNEHFMFDIATSVKSLSDHEYEMQLDRPFSSLDWSMESNVGPFVGTLYQDVPPTNLKPFGGHKGYGFGAMIDILCGVCSNANYLRKIPKPLKEQAKTPANLGQLYIAIDPKSFAPDYEVRLDDFKALLKVGGNKDDDNDIMVPGDIESLHMYDVEKNGGILYDSVCLRRCHNLAKGLGIQPLQMKPVWHLLSKFRR